MEGFESLVMMDPPEHTKMRQVANSEFLRSAVRARFDHIGAIAQQIVDDAATGGEVLECDFVPTFAGRLPVEVLQKAEEVVQREAFSVVSLDLAVHHAMAEVARAQVPDPFDRIIAATAVLADLPLLTADERIRAALGERAFW